ncbi:hypothetical protein B7494_g2903 [Chlorociboria aeruginascens]|nr:hypothetical protein B7494_g2903 [Chlorociboria aeruginascens]
MSRIQIPLDVLTSRLNLSDRFASVRSQSLGARFANLKPISEFLDIKRLSKPANFGEVQSRVNYNLGHFSSNYAVVFAMLSIYSLLTNWLLLFDIILVVGGMWAIGKLNGEDLNVAGFQATSSQLYTALLIVATRVEELDSDDTDTQGVGLEFGKKRFASDPLQFTGIDLSQPRPRKGYNYDSDESSDTSESDEEGTSAMQVALRDKEEALVQSALARIRRAQEKGKREVKLKKDELDALEKRRKRMQSSSTSKGRQGSGSGSGSGSERRRRSDKDLVTLPLAADPRRRRLEEVPPHPPAAVAPPGMLVAGPDGLTYAPIGYQSQAGLSRPRSATFQQLRATQTPYPQDSNRHFSEGMRPTSSSSTSSRRPLPDEEGWMPAHSRRSSVSSQYTVDPFKYQTSGDQLPPIPDQYARRNVSGPEIVYSSLRRSPPMTNYPPAARGVSDPILRKRNSHRDELGDSQDETTDEEGSDDLGNGVQVYVEEPAERERPPPAPPTRKPIRSDSEATFGEGEMGRDTEEGRPGGIVMVRIASKERGAGGIVVLSPVAEYRWDVVFGMCGTVVVVVFIFVVTATILPIGERCAIEPTHIVDFFLAFADVMAWFEVHTQILNGIDIYATLFCALYPNIFLLSLSSTSGKFAIMANSIPSDYYAALEIPSTSTQQQIRDAYKKAALKTHPDRVPSDSPERASRTRKFQLVNDAYYTLSDPARRKDYDAARVYHGFGSGASTASTSFDDDEEIPQASGPEAGAGAGYSFPWSSFGFSSKAKNEEEGKKFEEQQFGDVFEEMLREEGMAENGGKPTGKFWSMVGGLSGAAMGFIIANFPGMIAGAVAGNRLGSVRDARGKSVYEVFQGLDQGDKARLLSQLAAKVFSHAVGT